LAREIFGKTEVDHFDAGRVILASKHEILRLDIAMANVLPMQVD
jgi:hypothetical protein